MNTDATRWAILFLTLLVASGAIYMKYEATRPCARPILYSLGTIDTRFDIDDATLLNDAQVSAGVWNVAAGKMLFRYDPNADLKITLVYDERQAAAMLGESVSAQQRALELERASLDKADTLAVAKYNADVASFNAKVEQYNKSAGTSFNQGEYTEDANGRRIRIFEFTNDTQLERVLAHEFGHALGLEHNANPDSIMFAKNEGGSLAPTSDDLSALKKVCGLN